MRHCVKSGRDFRFEVNKRELTLIHSLVDRHSRFSDPNLMMWEHNLNEIKRGDITVPLPSAVDGWEDDVKKWPRITYGNIFSYFVDSVACDGKAMSNLKSSEAYQYLHSDKVGRVLFKDVGNDLAYLKADIEPSQSLHVTHHKAWVLVSVTGEVQTAGCSCIAGPGRSCSHAAALLWKVSKVRTIKGTKCIIVLCIIVYF